MEQQSTIIPWSDLEVAFCNTTPGFRRYLDLAMGRVVTVELYVLANITTLQWVAADPVRFIRIQSISSREQHGWMRRFIDTVEDSQLRTRLSEAIEGAGSFQRFRQILRGAPAERHRWFELRASLLREHTRAWLQLQGIVASEAPPASLRPGEAAKVIGESAEVMIGESELRGLALAQLERLPTHVLPSAVGFLRYLAAKTP